MRANQKNAKRMIASIILASIPALVFGLCTLVSSRDGHFFTTYALASVTFWVTSVLLGTRIPDQIQPGASRQRVGWLMFRTSSLACAASQFLLGGLNMTPLCVGRDNGDGTNDVFLCVLQTILVVIFYVLVLLPVTGIVPIVAGIILARRPAR
jgi:hypothetical protein